MITPEGTEYYIVSNINNQNWKGAVYVRQDWDPDTLYIGGTFDRPAVGTESLQMRIKFKGLGVYPLTGRQLNFSTIVGGDGIMNSYILAAGDSAKMEITKYDSTSKVLEGIFEGTLKKQHGDTTLPNSLHFVNGKFRGKIN